MMSMHRHPGVKVGVRVRVGVRVSVRIRVSVRVRVRVSLDSIMFGHKDRQTHLELELGFKFWR